MLQLVSDALQPVADAECDAAGRGMMTSSCGCLASLHVHLWVPWQRARRARRGKSLARCAAGRRAAGYHADAAHSPPLLLLFLSIPHSPAAVGEAPSSHLPLPFFLSFTSPAQPIRALSGGRA